MAISLVQFKQRNKMTKLLYLSDSYIQKYQAKVLDISIKGSSTAVILDQTIFYPEGGGQPSDQGIIKNEAGGLTVNQVIFNNGKPLHLGELSGNLNKGDVIECEINWDRRFHNMQVHSAGHILHEAIKNIIPEIAPISGEHGKNAHLVYKGTIDRTLKASIELEANRIIKNNLPILTKFVTLEELTKLATWIPENLPTGKPLRIIQIGNFPPIPDGGTQVKQTGEVNQIKVSSIDYDSQGNSVVHYAQENIQKNINKSKDRSNDVLIPVTNPFSSLIESAKDELHSPLSSKDKQDLHTIYLGKNGKLNQRFKDLFKASPDKKQLGLAFNLAKSLIQDIFETGQDMSSDSSSIDLTLPGIKPPIGHLHPVSQAIEEISSIFEKIGFIRNRYPEIDWDWYPFESLNMGKNHPARDEWETFFVDAKEHPTLGKMVLTPHTSNGQVREMERLKTPPIRMINIAKCYRRQSDVSHTVMFHQFEGLVVDTGINITHLKGTIDYFVRQFFGENRKSRLRPYHFQFTEPSFEVDITCDICDGHGCKLCKEGWLELGGAGMVHPNVLKSGKIDTKKYTGFAFGWGVERTYMMKSGIKIDDLRLLYSNDIRFLNQF